MRWLSIILKREAESFIPIDSDDEEMALEKVVLVPDKRAAETIDVHLSPSKFLEFDRCSRWVWTSVLQPRAVRSAKPEI